MYCREKPLKAGDKITLRNPESSYKLPPGIKDGTPAIFKSGNYGQATIEVDGKEIRISDRCIDHEFEYQVRGQWKPANDPEVMQIREAWRLRPVGGSNKTR